MSRLPFDPQADAAIGVDVGGTKTNVGIMNRNGDVLASVRVATQLPGRTVVDQVKAGIDEVMERFAVLQPGGTLRGIGVGTAGQVDCASGSIRFASELIPGYTGTPVKKLLEEAYGLPVYVDNDVNVLALTEKYIGAAKNAKHVICIALGTGVGGAVMTDGKVVHGAWGGAGEIGHMTVDFNGPVCICGNRGCLEQYVSGTSIGRRMQELLVAEGRPDEAVSARDVVERWLAGDAGATAIMNETVAALGGAIASLIHIFNPEVVVIGGGVAEAGEPLFAKLREEVASRAMSSQLESATIVPAYQGNLSGMLGAGLQMWED
ncbi:ROK family protein [Paenibacillus contaminans]|uniref:ROK family protein n=1 Tax=Paenibacillus contaminans TaxID=450362 RepID=A0A329MFX2_9BACL|nr:ROK family protein [Paenibacillus contaminans]RAV18582.1 ROK family protein [Paenibacillus contaminans]